MDWTHLFLAAASLLIVALLVWDAHDRHRAEVHPAEIMREMEHTLARVSEHTRHTS